MAQAPPPADPRAPLTADVELPFDGVLVGLGASAGGLDALDRFFSALPACDDAAFVVIQHLSPDHKTMMDNLLGRHTAMSVHVAQPDDRVRAGHVYVIPPGMTMRVAEGRLRLLPKPHFGLSLPIDDFFESLAREKGVRAMGIVLSGTGSDGSRGVVALDEAGAWVFAQEPASARFDGMPRSAIATGTVDLVDKPEALAREVAALINVGKRAPTLARITADPPTEAVLANVLRQLSTASGIDFTEYKANTVLRRIDRRVQATGCSTLEDYREHLAQHPAELDALRNDLLIPVTRFFRDVDAFAALQEQVLTPLVQARSTLGSKPIRVWVAATSTGEEAYSIALLLAQLVEQHGGTASWKVFATDVDARNIEAASSGTFPAASGEELPESVRARYFVASGDVLRIAPEIRQRVVFARHNLLSDPPFTQMDLVSCRNMLIYLRPAAQERALRRLQFAIQPGGVLFLGSSESLAAATGDFSVVDGRAKIFRIVKRPPPLIPTDLLDNPSTARSARGIAAPRAGRARTETRIVEEALDKLVTSYAPPAILVTVQRELVYVYGDARRFLGFQTGGASLDVLRLLPPEIAAVAATLLHAAGRDNSEKRSQPVAARLPDGGQDERVRLRVQPVGDAVPAAHFLLAFEPGVEDIAPLPGVPVSNLTEEHRRQIADFEAELTRTRDHLRETAHDLGTANEELQASNEELMAANEELQSTNEELQSVNEELLTVNAEYQSKIEMLNALNADLEGLTRATRVATLFVDRDLRIQRFTTEATRLFKLRDADLGRPLDEIAHVLDYPELFTDIRRAVSEGHTTFRETRVGVDQLYLANVLPYTELSGQRTRVVVTFVNVTHINDAHRLQTVLDALPANVSVLDQAGVVNVVNRGWREFAERNGDVGLRAESNYLDVCRLAAPNDVYAKRALEGLSEILEGRRSTFMMRYPCDSPLEKRWFLMHATTLGPNAGCVVSHFNVTGWLDPGATPALPDAEKPR